MDRKTVLYIIAGLVVALLIVLYFLVRNTRRNKLRKSVDELNVRFNAIKTIPLAFKLNKAQAIAKRNEETSVAVEEYYKKYEEAQKHIDAIQEMMNGIDDAINSRKYGEAREALNIVSENIKDSENEVRDIDVFLEQFSKKEEAQRDYSRKLKEEYREIKLAIQKKASQLSLAYPGLEKKLSRGEDLFSSSEEWMYANEYLKAQDDLDEIRGILDELKENSEILPDLIRDIRGVVPTMLDEVKRQYALVRQRGSYIAHLHIDDKLKTVEDYLKEDQKTLSDGDVGTVREHVRESKEILSGISDDFDDINKSLIDCREVSDNVVKNIADLERLENYVRVTYKNNRERFGLEDLSDQLDEQIGRIAKYKDLQKGLNTDLLNNAKPATELLKEMNELFDITEADRKQLTTYKNTVDKSNSDEERAVAQLMKLQVVVNEVEVKVREYHIPAIAGAYREDLVKSREYIADIKRLLNEVPLNTQSLNATLDEAIDFIYKFYNNVNNVVGMAIMVENAIVFGNKYRSTYPEIDRELSKAEFSYRNGEYTRALTIAINCMET
ncbi:MAG: hypothetical protein IIZ33_05065, partial [Erysipelotrichaceae bacterium]|nr:hypothetical protein [Erysipelotrichaceae bacterium]